LQQNGAVATKGNSCKCACQRRQHRNLNNILFLAEHDHFTEGKATASISSRSFMQRKKKLTNSIELVNRMTSHKLQAWMQRKDGFKVNRA